MARPPRADAAAASAEAMSGRCSGSSAPSRSPRWGSSEQGRRWRLLPVPGRLGAAVAWACLAARPRGAAAWAKEGHQRIARVASELIKGVKRQKVNALLSGSLIEFADWEQQMFRKAPETEALHWHRQDPEWTCQELERKGEDKAAKPSDNLFGAMATRVLERDEAGHIRCDGPAVGTSLFCALVFFFEHFAHDELLSEYPAPKEPITSPTELKALAALPSSEHTPANYLRWLVTLIGDLHQPLHWLRSNEHGGAVKVTFRGKARTLLELWEEDIPAGLPKMPSWGYLEHQYKDRQPAWWHKAPSELFRIWAQEMGAVVCNQVYGPMSAAGMQPGQPFELSEELYQRWVDLAQDFTTLAGERLAFVLLDILEHRRHRKDHLEGRGRHHRKKRWQRGFMKNLGVAAVVVPGLLVLLRMHARGSLGWLSQRNHAVKQSL